MKNVGDITLRQIEIFLTVAQSRSFSEAGRHLFIDQSGVSRWIQRLETVLGTQLFIRHNKGAELTPAGEFLYDEIMPAFGVLNNAVSTIINVKNDPNYTIKIGCLNDEEVLSVFNDSVFQFRILHPDIFLKVDLYSFDELRRKFVNEELNIAVSLHLGFGEYKNTQHLILKEESAYFVLAKDSPVIIDGNLCKNLLNNMTLYLIAPPEVELAEGYILDLCKEQEIMPDKIKYLPNMLAIELVVKNGQGFTFGSEVYLKHFPDELCLFRITSTMRSQRISVFWHSNNIKGIDQRFIESLSS